MLRILGHTLDFQRKNLQFVHHPGHTVGNHAKVFATWEHGLGFKEFGKLFHGGLVPEFVVALIVVMVVETHEVLALVGVEAFEDEAFEGRNARMILVALLVVGDEKDVVDKGVESVADVFGIVLTAAFAVEPVEDIALCGVFRTQTPHVVVAVLEERGAHIVGIAAEDTGQDFVVDKRPRHEILVKLQTVALDFVLRHRQGRGELSEYALDAVDGNFPNAEESEDVVDAVGREIFRHLGEAAFPP